MKYQGTFHSENFRYVRMLHFTFLTLFIMLDLRSQRGTEVPKGRQAQIDAAVYLLTWRPPQAGCLLCHVDDIYSFNEPKNHEYQRMLVEKTQWKDHEISRDISFGKLPICSDAAFHFPNSFHHARFEESTWTEVPKGRQARHPLVRWNPQKETRGR